MQSPSSIVSYNEGLLPAHSQSNFYMHTLVLLLFTLLLPLFVSISRMVSVSYSTFFFQNFLYSLALEAFRCLRSESMIMSSRFIISHFIYFYFWVLNNFRTFSLWKNIWCHLLSKHPFVNLLCLTLKWVFLFLIMKTMDCKFTSLYCSWLWDKDTLFLVLALQEIYCVFLGRIFNLTRSVSHL